MADKPHEAFTAVLTKEETKLFYARHPLFGGSRRTFMKLKWELKGLET